MRYLQPGSPYARHTAAITKNNKSSNSGLGSLRITFHTTMLIDSILRAGSLRTNPSAKPPTNTIRVLAYAAVSM
jgi:hypothetical protein